MLNSLCEDRDGEVGFKNVPFGPISDLSPTRLMLNGNVGRLVWLAWGRSQVYFGKELLIWPFE